MKNTYFLKLLSIFFVLGSLVACSATDGGSAASTAKTGRVSLLITDAPAPEFDQINVTIESITLIADDGDEDAHEDDGDKNDDSDKDDDEADHSEDKVVAKDTVLLKEVTVVNLLALQNISDLLATATVPVGTYSKIRLKVSKVELVKYDYYPDGTEFRTDAKLPSGKIDLNPRGSFDVTGDGHLVIELDMDAKKSIHIVETGKGKNQYIFRPVVFVSILGEKDIKLVMLDGKVLSKDDSGFQLCKPEAIEVDDDCLSVRFTGDTVVQDDLIDVVSEDEVSDGDRVTVLGKAYGNDFSALHIVIASADKSVQNLGLFTGATGSDVDVENVFSMVTDDGGSLVSPGTELSVLIADGARIFDRYGSQISNDKLLAGSHVNVFGLAQQNLATVEKVKAAFVIYDAAKAGADNKLTGTIVSVDVDEAEMTLSIVTDTFSGDVCINMNAADIFMLKLIGEDINSEEVGLEDMKAGMSVDVYLQGDEEGYESCQPANVVLATE